MTNKKDLIPDIIDAIQDRKGKAVTIVDMSHIEAAPVPEFVIAEGSSTMNVAAIADSVREKLLETDGIKPYNYEGYTASEWIVLDYGSLLVHVFLPDSRRRYCLEELWSDARIKDIPDLDWLSSTTFNFTFQLISNKT